MNKLKIIKLIALTLGACIIFCVLSVFSIIINKNTNLQKLDSNIILNQKGNVKSFSVENNKIYILLEDSGKDKIIVVDEKKYAKLYTIDIN